MVVVVEVVVVGGSFNDGSGVSSGDGSELIYAANLLTETVLRSDRLTRYLKHNELPNWTNIDHTI